MDEYRSLLSKLISIPSVNPMGRAVSGPEFHETAITAFLEEWLAPLDVEVQRQNVLPGRDNLLATYGPPNATAHIMLEVHTDTVPVDSMVIPPFTPNIEGNRLYGRGACDNKGPMTAMLLALKRLATEKPAGAARVTLALVCDEEYTFLGVQHLAKQKPKVDCAIVAEPTSLDIVVAHKGIVRWMIETTGRACHSSTPDKGVNAIYRMAPVLAALERYNVELSRRPVDPFLGGPTLSVGLIQGGVSVNTVPDFCRIEIDRRLNPGESPADAYGDVVRFLREDPAIDASLICHPPGQQMGAMGANLNGKIVERFGESIDRFRGSHRNLGVPFGTDAATLHTAGIPSLVFGPGSIDQAHTKDEWIDLDQIPVASEIYFDFCVRAGQAT